MVHYLLPGGRRMGEERPATVVRVNPDMSVNLLVHLDGPNDLEQSPTPDVPTSRWVGTVRHNPALHRVPGSYHWASYNPPSEQEER